jgi:hypothetical protein
MAAKTTVTAISDFMRAPLQQNAPISIHVKYSMYALNVLAIVGGVCLIGLAIWVGAANDARVHSKHPVKA